jgi:sugar (pentulose or hexulose) kinase
MRGHVIVIDVGKTLSKASLWSPEGRMLERLTRPNRPVRGPGYAALDAAGIEEWLSGALRQLAALAPVTDLVPVAHGAAFALVRDGRLAVPPMDYEQANPCAIRGDYEVLRDPFASSGSPALPDGLNAGVQLHWLEAMHPRAFDDGTRIVPWPQYWAWRLCGVAASEVTSLGCHTDLWSPATGGPSALARRRGWAAMFAPLRRAGDVLGSLGPEWVARTGLPATAQVHCGLHDSNAALVAARGFPEIAGHEATVLSTGTWFVALRTPGAGAEPDIASLPEARDCLVNVDAWGRMVPSARFMGGREIETLTGIDTRRVDIAPDQPRLLEALPRLLAGPARVLPTFAAGCGPFPHARGRWVAMPVDEAERRAAVCLYAALVADVSLGLVGARERLLIEGRFAEAQVFVRSLATLRPDMAVYTANARNDVSYGALRLLDPSLAPASRLRRAEPLPHDLAPLRRAWREEAERMEHAA